MYDYIIVGAGSAGCVLASRLSEDPQTSVLLLEAGGPDEAQEIHIPVAFSKLFQSPLDWNYTTEEEPNLKNRKLYWPRGKVLGGSGSINAMIYIRGNHYDYDHWQELGNQGWSYTDVLPYFKKAENQERGESEYHGTGGPLNVTDRVKNNPLSHAFIEAGKEMSLPENPDFSGESQDGVGVYQVTQRQGRRHSAAVAYLHPALGRPNLTVLTQAHATRVLFEGKRAVGVAYIKDGQPQEIRANKEVILSGGTVNSPQLLLLSGVGPASTLKALGIDVIADLPGVGENLQDHPFVSVCFSSNQPISLANAESVENFQEYMTSQTGPLASNIAEVGGFVKTRPELPEPDLQFHFAPIYYINHGFTMPEGHGFTIGPTLVTPKSRGSVKLHSNDPMQHPAITGNYLADPEDLRVMIEGIKLCRQLADTRAFAELRDQEILPGSQVQSDADLESYIRENL
ncbi:MAG TPA: GMC family oxidoreductase N-terminal domain-containing protein, partial [Ktedonobacteraceae bacterium]|nr:GMC family oxidoreductase N-terminal domain-containing protein [Ktedonobacteraceae bacterium]